MKDRLVCGEQDNALQKLQKRGLTLETCIKVCRTSESTMPQLKAMGNEEPSTKSSRKQKQAESNSKQEEVD